MPCFCGDLHLSDRHGSLQYLYLEFSKKVNFLLSIVMFDLYIQGGSKLRQKYIGT